MVSQATICSSLSQPLSRQWLWRYSICSILEALFESGGCFYYFLVDFVVTMRVGGGEGNLKWAVRWLPRTVIDPSKLWLDFQKGLAKLRNMPKTVREKSNNSVLLVWHCCSSKSVKVSWMQRIKTQSIQKVCQDSQEPVRMWFEQKLMPRKKDEMEQFISIYAWRALQNQTGILQNAPSVGRVRLSDLVRMVWTWVVSRLKLVHGD